MPTKQAITIVVPAHNEERNLSLLHAALTRVMAPLADIDWKLLLVDDGSTDGTLAQVKALAAAHANVAYVELSRNFGKEIATTAGLHHATGDAVLLMDADLQHPPELIPEFLAKWRAGADIVIGIRRRNSGEGWLKRWGSRCFNRVMAAISETKFIPNETDFRLISRPVIEEFRRFTERDRLTRGLLDWLGFRRDFVTFDAAARATGEASYGPLKLVQTALNSFLTHSMLPLKLAGYLGAVITPLAGLMGLFILIEKYFLGDPLGYNFSGPAILAVILIFLVGIILACLGLVALYIGGIHREVMNRPLYAVRSRKE
jgi:dolichol-phosphate mannosyltransferase